MIRFNYNYFVRILGACTRCSDIVSGKQVHSLIVKQGFVSNDFVATALLDMYSKCGFIDEAHVVFDEILSKDLVSWNVMLSCYSLNGFYREAFEAFRCMWLAGVLGDEFTFSSLVNSCSRFGCIKLGKQIHGLAMKLLSLHTDVVVSSALVDMYTKCGEIGDVRRAFDVMHVRNVVSWNSIIVSYGVHTEPKEAVKLLTQMLQTSSRPDELTLASVLSSCADIAAANEATQVHSYAIKAGLEAFVSVGNALIVAYAKCGNIHSAYQAFSLIPKPNLFTWSSMISSYAFHGLAEEAMHAFNKMLQQGVNPDKVAFLAILSACSHAGLVKEGLCYFNSMTRDYKINPGSEHYTCLIDLLGRAGYIREAYNLIANMSFEPGGDVLGAFIGACKLHCKIELAKWAADKLFEVEPDKPVNYMLMSNSNAAFGFWDEVARARRMMRRRCGGKVPGCSWLECGGTVATFVSDDRSCLKAIEMYAMLEILIQQMEEEKSAFDFDICSSTWNFT